MKSDLRRNLQHIGDIFVDTVQKAADSAVAFSKGAVKNCGQNLLQTKKEKVAGEIIERVSALIKGGDSEVCRDTTLTELITKFNGYEKDLCQYKEQRTKSSNPIRSLMAKLGTSK